MMNHVLKSILIFSLLAPLAIWAADSDHDGVDDSIDKCPNTAQLKNVESDFKFAITVNPERLTKTSKAWPVLSNGCEPDDDNDGVNNSQDYCPDDTPQAISKGVASNGCPVHNDRDGTPDYRDHCPNTPSGLLTDNDGCPVKGAKPLPKEHVSNRIQKLLR